LGCPHYLLEFLYKEKNEAKKAGEISDQTVPVPKKKNSDPTFI